MRRSHASKRLRWPACLLPMLFLAMSPFHLPQHCHRGSDTRPEELALIATSFDKEFLTTTRGGFMVLTPKKRPQHSGGPPVLVLPEMAALSPDVLKLGLRVRDAGYSVYIPVLWGGEDENAHSPWVFLHYFFELRRDPRWRAGEEDVDRPVLADLVALCRERILREHAGQRLGVIGNCVTGVLPFALAARVPEIAAAVASQPALPLSTNSQDDPRTGLWDADKNRLKSRIARDPNFQLLGFRFWGDPICKAERFTTLQKDFGPAFIDGTIPSVLYHDRDHLPLHLHSVLSECALHCCAPSTDHAFKECLGFLQAKLRSGSPVKYHFRPYSQSKP